MPHRWMRCPDPAKPELVEIPDCLACSKTDWGRGCAWTYPVLKLMVVDSERDYMSPTGLTKDPREWMLIHALDYAVDPEKAWARVRGTVMHANLEGDEEGRSELTLQRTLVIGGTTYILKGRTDLIHTAGRFPFIRDWKTTDLSSQWRRDQLPKPEHIAQLSVYGWMAAENEAPVAAGSTLAWPSLAHGELVYIGLNTQQRELVKLWDHERVERYVRQRLPLRHRMMRLGMQAREEGWTIEQIAQLDLPPHLPASDWWKVRYMDVQEQYLELMRLRGESVPTEDEEK